MKVPMLEVPWLHAPIREELAEKMVEVLDSGAHINGRYVEQFEKELAGYCGCKEAIGVSSGSDALIVSLMAMGVKPGDEVITSPFTFFATVGAIARVGAVCVFADIDPKTFNLDPASIEAKITEKTVGVIPVPLFGLSCDMTPIMATAKTHDLWVMEDAAQSLGAKYNGKMCGTTGTVGTYSFFPAKNLGCVGDGGAVVTDNEELASRIRMFRNHGGHHRYYYDEVGGNFRLDALQAGVLSVKLPHLKGWEKIRRDNASAYIDAFAGIEHIKTPFVPDNCGHVFNQFTMRIGEGRRDEYQQKLTEKGIAAAVYYPMCLHEQKCFADLGYKTGDFPQSEKAAQEVLSIPVCTDKAELVIEAVKSI